MDLQILTSKRCVFNRTARKLFDYQFKAEGLEPALMNLKDGEEPSFHPKRDWIENFNKEHPMPGTMPDDLYPVMAGCPAGFEVPMLLSLLSLYGTYCFSRVRSINGEGKKQSFTGGIIIEGDSGSGKEKFNTLRDALFGPIINEDAANLSDPNKVCQSVSINISEKAFVDLLVKNQGLHMYIAESEIASVTRMAKSGGAVSYDILRLAFDGGKYGKITNTSKHSNLKVLCNFAFTGTSADVATFLKNQEEGGTANRFALCLIPELGEELPTLELPPESTITKVQNSIYAWRNKYCVVRGKDRDSVAPEHEIDLSYLNKALREWTRQQYKLFEKDKIVQRNSVRGRIGTMAFKYGMVLAMMYGEPAPGSADAVATTKMTLFIADYLMARYLSKFGAVAPHKSNKRKTNHKRPSPELVSEMKILHDMKDTKGNCINGWDVLAKKFPEYSRATIWRSVKALEGCKAS